jgi:hypothetical protein
MYHVAFEFLRLEWLRHPEDGAVTSNYGGVLTNNSIEQIPSWKAKTS